MRRAALYLALALALASGARAQSTGIRAWTALYGETYSFDGGYLIDTVAVDRVSQLTVPVGVTVPLGAAGRFGGITLSGGYTYVDVAPVNAATPSPSISTLLDTELRFSWNAIPGRLIVFAKGAIPTGTHTVASEELSTLVLIATDVIGFATSNLGTGGALGGGVAGAFPLGGSWALGVGGSVRGNFSYTVIEGDSAQLNPGTDLRLRGGVEGPLARRTYLRAAVTWARRGVDQAGFETAEGSEDLNGIGDRLVGYLSLDQGIGNSVLNIYVFDVFRTDPQLEATVVGAAILPRGNLLGAGARFDWRFNRSMALVPKFEYRLSLIAERPEAGGTADNTLQLFGESFRFGADWRYRFARRWNLVVQAEAAFGRLVQELDGERVKFGGPRAAVHLEWTP
jgi:hypothetical protein